MKNENDNKTKKSWEKVNEQWENLFNYSNEEENFQWNEKREKTITKFLDLIEQLLLFSFSPSLSSSSLSLTSINVIFHFLFY